MNIELIRDVDAAISLCISYLDKGSEDETINHTHISSNQEMINPYFISSVYIPAYIGHSVSFLNDSNVKMKIISSISRFLLDNIEESGIWRFHGKSDKFPPPDFDDTCCSIAALKKNGINTETELWNLLPRYASKVGLYYTWIDDDLNKQSFYHTDLGININILFCASLFDRKITDIINFVNPQSTTRNFSHFSIYSVSDYSIIYMISRAFRDGDIQELKMAMNNVVEFLKIHQHSDGTWGNDLDNVLGFAALVNANHEGPEVGKSLVYLLNQLNNNRLFKSHAFFKALYPAYYGSPYLTIAIFMEALLKYRNARKT